MSTKGRSARAAVIGICFAVGMTASSAGSLKRKMVGVGTLLGGIALYQSATKGCHPKKNPETGKVIWFCDRGPSSGASGEILKSSGTYQLRKALNAERTTAGLPPDPDDCDAHHIVPKGESRQWASDMVASARSSLEGCVDIDSAENGIYLPAKKSGSQCPGSYHKSLHSKAYYTEVEDRLRNAKQFEGCDAVKEELTGLKQDLINGGKW